MVSPRTATLVLSLILMTVTSSFADTGAPNASLDSMLKAQNLTAADLEANRAGKVSQHQAEMVDKARGGLSIVGIAGIGSVFVAALGFALYDYSKKSKPAVFVLPAIAFVLGLGFWVFFTKVLQLPSVAGKTVTVVEGPIGGLINIVNGGGYNVSIQGVRYKGVATGLTPDLKGTVVKAYVVPESKMVVAIEPK